MRISRVFLLALALTACEADTPHERLRYDVVCPPRDFAAHPAVVVLDAPASALYAISDVHGGYDRMVALLVKHAVLADVPQTPGSASWQGKDATLVVTGDLMDKGPDALLAIELLMALEPRAEAEGGHVIFTLGNHEAEFLDDPSNDKAEKQDGVNEEIRQDGLTPVALASGSDPRGRWLRDRPFAARIGGWFFAHGGSTRGRTVAELEVALRQGLAAHDYNDAEIIGADSLLEARGWYGADGGVTVANAKALDARHVVFGHDPNALGARGEIAVAFDGMLLRIDCGMSPTVNDSEGKMLRVRATADGATEVAESLAPDGSIKELWRGAR